MDSIQHHIVWLPLSTNLVSAAQHSTDSPVAQPVRQHGASSLDLCMVLVRGALCAQDTPIQAHPASTRGYFLPRGYFYRPVLPRGLPCYLKQAICNCLVSLCFPWATGSARDPFAALRRSGFMQHAAPCSLRAQVSEPALGTVQSP